MRDRFSKYWKKFMDIIKRKEMGILPAHLAYYFIISVVPALTIVFTVTSLLNIPTSAIFNFLSSIFSKTVASSIVNNIYSSAHNILFLILVFYITSNGAKSIITASNIVFNVEDKSPLRKIIKSFIITFFLIILITFILIVPLFGTQIISLLTSLKIDTRVINSLNILYPILKWPLTLFIVFIFIKLIYTMGPDEKIKSSYVNKGAIFTTISWSIITAAYSFYINNIANYTLVYGPLSNIVILMLWFYLLSYVFVIGLVLNYKNSEEENEKTNTIKLKEIQEKIKKNSDKLK